MKASSAETYHNKVEAQRASQAEKKQGCSGQGEAARQTEE